MEELQMPKHDDKPFYVRLKQIDMSNEDYEKEKLDSNHMFIRDTRGRIFRLAHIRGEFLRTQQGNKEYPIIARVQEREDGNFDLLSIVSEPLQLPTKADSEENIDDVENSK